MHKILVVTDLHMLEVGGTIIGLDPFARLRRVLDKAAADHPDAARVILLGDLTHHGKPEQYARLRECLGDLPWPVSITIGNHDRRDPFVAAFPKVARDENGYVQEVIDLPGWRLVLLDSNDEPGSDPHHSGILCADRMAWLDRALATAGDRQVVVLVHHTPMITFFNGMDRIWLRNAAEFLALLKRYGNVQQVIAGHIHRTISGVFDGVPVTVFKSPCHQMPMDMANETTSVSVDEPGAFGMLLLHDRGVTVHSEDVF